MNLETVRSYGFGGLLAVLVIGACFILFILGKPLEPGVALLLIAMVALSRLT